jgi:hypothetical protein
VRPDIRSVGRGLFPLHTVGAIESLESIGFTRYAKSGT